MSTSSKSLLLLSLAAGLFFGLVIYTFVYAKGYSYLSDKPEACANCHVMNTVYEGWMKGGHQHVATCNDCHVPHSFIGKWSVKALNGFNHSKAFTLGDVPVYIRANQFSKSVVADNCIRCHGNMAGHAARASSGEPEPLACTSCHRSVGHPH